jgi:hypothetical protein
MATKRLPRPRDPIALARLIGDIATGQVVDVVEDGKDPAAAEMGRKGAAARSRSVSPERRAEIAKKAQRSGGATANSLGCRRGIQRVSGPDAAEPAVQAHTYR